MSDLMRWPGSRDKSGGPKPDNSWVKYVCDSHLEWLMSWVPIRTTPRGELQRGKELDVEDTERYNIIKEQAEMFMAQAKAEKWTEDERRVRMVNVWWRADHANS